MIHRICSSASASCSASTRLNARGCGWILALPKKKSVRSVQEQVLSAVGREVASACKVAREVTRRDCPRRGGESLCPCLRAAQVTAAVHGLCYSRQTGESILSEARRA